MDNQKEKIKKNNKKVDSYTIAKEFIVFLKELETKEKSNKGR